MINRKIEAGLYIHIPFCKSKCKYCDFRSFAQKEHLFASYQAALLGEIKGGGPLADSHIKTIFIGGGTPTMVPPSYIAQILEALSRYSIDSRAEITIEANPGTLDATACRDLKKSGINRLSIGLQAWQDRHLHSLGRIHRQKDFLKSYETAMEAGFDNINIDLMFSLPGQTTADWQETLEKVTELAPAHLSVYGLMIEEGTAFGELWKQGLLQEVDEELDRSFYAEAKDFLRRKGYARYEISNFAQEGRECRHNLGYWQRKPYMGLGLSAHSFFEGLRFQNTDNLDAYIKAQGDQRKIRENFEIIGQKEAQAEFMFLGLRMTSGVTGKDFYARFGIDMLSRYGNELQKLIHQGLLLQDGDRYFLTDIGVDVSNFVFGAFV